MKESGKERLKYVVYESTLSTAPRSPFPNGEGLGGATLRVNLYKERSPIKNYSRPFLWKGQTSEARRGWHPRVRKYRFMQPTSAPSGHLLPKEGGSVPPSRIVISSESEKSFSFAVKKGCGERDHGKHRTPNDFIPLREPTSAPFGAPPSKGRREKSGMRNECGEAATLIPNS